ncbi:uncharacterized protein LOC110982475 isoform X2 [Acanthaster planci]|uniref:Uncharacterized protein LOC110982475 isoform X2 n=1 Tax=Acanthaster planci TaxID=133434 RepID=A0A8B7YV68_ACAPL|nr:uncharacterized protein LOC110982475 isoform X2 [Acanthaster planci]
MEYWTSNSWDPSSEQSDRSVPVHHAALDSWLVPGKCKHQRCVDGVDRPVTMATGANSHQQRSAMSLMEDTSGVGSLQVSTDVQTYFNTLESRQCRTSSVGPAHTLRIEQRLPVVRSDGQDSGVEDLGMASPCSPNGLDAGTKTTLTQKEFMVYRRALLCSQFPVLSSPKPTSSPDPPSPYAYPLSPPAGAHHPPAFPFLASRTSQAQLMTPDKAVPPPGGSVGVDGWSDEESEEEVLVQNEMLAGLVRKAFQLNEERHRYYDEVISEGLSRKAPARILVEELVSRLSVVENNKHPFYHPQAFEPRAYDIWQQGERRHISELIESFWQFSLPSPVTSMVKPSYWQSVHEEYTDLMVRLIRLDRRQAVNSFSASLLRSTSRRLLKEFGLRYGVGELYRRIVFLEYLASNDHFESEVWYMEMILRELTRLSMQLPVTSFQARFIMVRQEFELLLEVLTRLHEHSKHGLQGLLQIQEDSSYRAVALVNLLSSVLNLKLQLTGRKGYTLEHYLEGYIKESAKQAYLRHKLRLETELSINTYVSPITAELVTRLVGCAEEDVRRCLDYYHGVFGRYNQEIVKLAATTFYSNLMTDVNVVCEMSNISEDLQSIDQELLALAQKLNELDTAWKDYIPRQAQQWRQPMLAQAKAWLKTMTKQLTHLVVKVVDTDKFTSDFGTDVASVPESSEPRQFSRQTSILRHSPFSAFTTVSSSAKRSPDRVKIPKDGSVQAVQSNLKSKSRKTSEKPRDVGLTKTEAGDVSGARGSVLYMNAGSDLKRVKSLPDMTHHDSLGHGHGLRRNVTTADLQQAQTAGQVQFHNIDNGVVSFSKKDQRIPDTLPQEADASGRSSRSEGGAPTQGTRVSPTEVDAFERDMPVLTESSDIGALDEVYKDKEKILIDSSNNNSTDKDKNRDSPSSVIPVKEDTAATSPTSENGLVTQPSSGQDTCPDIDIRPGPEIGPSTDSSPGSERTGSTETAPGPGATSHAEQDISPPQVLLSPNVVAVDHSEIEVMPHSRTASYSDRGSEAAVLQSGGLSETNSHTTSTHSSHPNSSPTSSLPLHPAPESKATRAASVSFKMDSLKPEDSQPDGFSSSLVDVMFMTQRIIGFMQKLIGILCPADVEMPLGPDRDFTGSFSIRSFFVRVATMKTELKEVTEGAIIKVLCLYANNLLAMDLCATEKDKVDQLVDEKVLHGVLVNRQESMLSRCRHEREGNLPCDYYLNRDTALLCDKHEPITRQMCVRINNTWSILCLLPKLTSMLQSRLRGHPPSPIASEDEHQNRIYNEPVEQADLDGSSLAEGDHKLHLDSVLQAQIQLLAHKLNLVLQQALHVLLTPDFDELTIGDRLQPLTSCLYDHREALGRWLTPPCLRLFMQRLWLCLVGDFEREVEGLRLLKEQADSQALLLSQSISEVILNTLQLHSLSSKILIHLYRKQLSREAEVEAGLSDPLPTEVLQTMYQALHKQRKCFTGHHMVMWLLVHYFKAQDQPVSRRIKYKRKAQKVGQRLLDVGVIQHITSRSRTVTDICHDDLAGFSSDTSVTDSTPYPVVTIDSVPKTSIRRRSQDLGNDSSEDSLEVSAMQERPRRTKRRISDFYSEEMESSDESSSSKSGQKGGRTIVLKAEVHVSATADSDEVPGVGQKDASASQSQLSHQDVTRQASSGEESPRRTPPPESQPKMSFSRKFLRGAFSSSHAPSSPSSSSSASKQESSTMPSRHAKQPESRQLFSADTQHFYYFRDVDDPLLYSLSMDSTRSGSPLEDREQSRTGKPSRKPYPHWKHPLANADYLLGILLCRRRRSSTAKEFTRSVPNKFWEEDSNSPCCSCFT